MNAIITEIAGTLKDTAGMTVFITPTQQIAQKEITGKKMITSKNVMITHLYHPPKHHAATAGEAATTKIALGIQIHSTW